MPPKRRSAGAGAASAARTQATLSFNNKNRVTKQSNILPPSDKKPSTKRLSDQAKAEIIDEITEVEAPKVAEIIPEPEVVREGTATEAQSEETRTSRPKRKSKKESPYDLKIKQAEKLSDTKIKAYWRAEEDSRLAPRGK